MAPHLEAVKEPTLARVRVLEGVGCTSSQERRVEDRLGGVGRDALGIQAHEEGIERSAAVEPLERSRRGRELGRSGVAGNDEMALVIEADRGGRVLPRAADDRARDELIAIGGNDRDERVDPAAARPFPGRREAVRRRVADHGDPAIGRNRRADREIVSLATEERLEQNLARRRVELMASLESTFREIQ